jgi:excisionase family DNA binding protein
MKLDEDYSLDIPCRIERRRKVLTVKELAAFVSLSTKQIYELVAKGHIPSYRIAGAIRFDPSHTATWLRSQSA